MISICIKPCFKIRLVFVVLICSLVSACGPKEPAHTDIVRGDLAVIIDSLGSPCDKVLEYEATADLEYIVNCQSGDRYVISVNPQGRVGHKVQD